MTTANMLDTIQPALRDRMEIIRLAGYTEEEKLEIARRHLMPKQMEENGITAKQPAHLEDGACGRSFSNTRRKRACASSNARSARSAARSRGASPKGKTETVRVTPKNLHEFLGAPKIFPDEVLEEGPDRRGHRAGVDGRRRRHALHRGAEDEGQGQARADRPARRRDAGIGAGGLLLRQVARQGARTSTKRTSTTTTSTSTSPKARFRRTARRPASRWRRRWFRCSRSGPSARMWR